MVRGNKILIKIFIIILLFLGITLVMGNNKVFGLIADPSLSLPAIKWGGFGPIYSNPYLYCIEHLQLYHGDRDYQLVERGNLETDEQGRQIAYLVANYAKTLTDIGDDTSENDPVSNAIWALVPRTTSAPANSWVDITNIMNESKVSANLNKSVSIESVEDVMMNEDGKYGPFKVYYPNYYGIMSGTVQVKVNGNILSDTPASGQDFYLTEAELTDSTGVIPAESTLEVIYNDAEYSGTYSIWEPVYVSAGLPQELHVIENEQEVIQIEELVKKELAPMTASIRFKTCINISGKVWLDGQTGLKPVMEPNGLQDRNEEMLSGIQVIAKRGSDNSIAGTTYTDANGRYELKNIPTDSYGIYVEFVYDGVNYKVTKPNAGIETIDSDVQDVDRTGFNNKFKTIRRNVAIGTSGSILLQYENFTTLKTKNADGTVKSEFAIRARTIEGYKENTDNVDCGLVKKGVDLATVTELLSADVSINGVTKTYGYNDILNIDIDRFNMQAHKYTLALYKSDYNYRINDTISDNWAHNGFLYRNSVDDGANKVLNNLKELEINLTYQVLLNNQSATQAKINQIAYYYDKNLIINEIKMGSEIIPILDSGATLVNIAGKQYKKQIFNLSNCTLGNSGQQSFQLVFSVDKDKSYIGEMKNWVEIISYSTDEGCIDSDSAPDNITEHWEEDDSDDAGALNIKLNENERQISGYVFEDKKSNTPGTYNVGNGLYNKDEDKIVNGVIVQLIELKEADGKLLEYIWQETVSGSNKVKYVKNDGSGLGEYNVENEKGEYTFKNFIPSTNYIIRFIYGDGTYYDLSSDEVKANILKYNGQDYKSTIDSGYNIKWYFDETYASNASMARDNEARRLEEIAYAKGLGDNVVDLKIDSKAKLENTWMCAESSIIYVPLPTQSDGIEKLEKTINFGLVKRPQIKLELEKHIIGLNVAEGKAKATTNLEGYYAEGVNLQSQQGEYIFASPSNRGNNQIGSWMVQTAIEDISGKPIEITYGYKVKNMGDEVYISRLLKEKLDGGMTYEEIAQNVKEGISTTEHSLGKYLGEAYYSGKKSDEDVSIANSIDFQIEDYIDIGLTTEGTDFTIYKENENKSIFDSKSNKRSETFKVIRTENMKVNGTKTLGVNGTIDTTSTAKSLTYRSSVAQVIPVAGNKIAIDGTAVDNGFEDLEVVKSYANTTRLKDIAPKEHQYVAETVVITMDTGLDKVTPIILIVSITGGLAVIAIGIILIKKFVIK